VWSLKLYMYKIIKNILLFNSQSRIPNQIHIILQQNDTFDGSLIFEVLITNKQTTTDVRLQRR